MSDRIVIAGSRSLDPGNVWSAFVQSPWESHEFHEVVHGGAEGIDQGASEWASAFQKKETVFEVTEDDWDEHGKAAGPMRNQEMAEYGTALLAVWDGESRGTRSMIRKALDESLPTYVHVVNE